MIDVTWSELENIELDGIDTKDYPDFCDAYISSAFSYRLNRDLNDNELDYVTDTFKDNIYELVFDKIF